MIIYIFVRIYIAEIVYVCVTSGLCLKVVCVVGKETVDERWIDKDGLIDREREDD